MTYLVEQIASDAWPTCNSAPDTRWLKARPLPGPLWMRAKDAWLVLTGKADAVMWTCDQNDGGAR